MLLVPTTVGGFQTQAVHLYRTFPRNITPVADAHAGGSSRHMQTHAEDVTGASVRRSWIQIPSRMK